MRVALAQLNPTVGDIEGNTALVKEWYERARAAGADLVAFPEMVLSGYPPEDLLLRGHFVEECEAALSGVAAGCTGPMAVIGTPVRVEAGRGRAATDPPVANAAAVVFGGRVVAVYKKIHLPNYAVFDEERYFTPGDWIPLLEWGNERLSVNVCEDIWNPGGPTEEAALTGRARLVVNISMSPYHMGKGGEREQMLRRRAADAGAFVVYVNGVGGQDELVFDGHSVVAGPDGSLVARGAQFEEQLLVVDLDLSAADEFTGEATPRGAYRLRTVRIEGDAASLSQPAPPPAQAATTSGASSPGAVASRSTSETPRRPLLSKEAEVYAALRLGIRDYAGKNGFKRVIIGLSGGIDSALTACIAVDALGAEAVTGVTMPSRYSASDTRSDARILAQNLGIDFLELPIEGIFVSYLETLAPVFAGHKADTTEENLQARIRGNLLMALSNKFGWLVLTTGNKSEMAVGYATLYGDMAGGFAVIKDVPKTLVYDLSRYRNSVQPGAAPIPESTITRPPSAELRPDQTDQDSLPPYHLLDRIIDAYVVRDESVEAMIAAGMDRAEVERMVALIDRNEYKRRQAAPGVRITLKAFGKDRRLPITNRYRSRRSPE
ncbi:MAG: NAD+ synthase [Thermoleophilia bacterium]